MVIGYDKSAIEYFGKSRLFLDDAEAAAFQRAMIGAAYWLDCSPHERTNEDAVAMAEFIRMIAPRIGTPIKDDDFDKNGDLKPS